MPLKKVEFGPNEGARECVLERFRVDPTGLTGTYTNDPVEKCLDCNFQYGKKLPTQDDNACKCPLWMTWDIYDVLRGQFGKYGDKKKEGFHKLINYLSENNINNLKAVKEADLEKIIKSLI